ncbi:MAG: hypothetical protein KAH05_00475, partial [Clostridiales bacterium]|nr:hypothetical protein [Clostridiales bacterium]
MKKLLLIASICLLFSCSKNSDADYIDVGIHLKLENSSGSDLLDPSVDNSYNNDNIKLFHLLNGTEQYYLCGNCDNQKGYYFFERDNKYVMSVFTNIEVQQDGTYPITYIQWNETDRDTIQCHINRSKDGSYIFCNKVWYNDSLVYDNNG